jgi:hypothetical protein
MTWLGSPLYLQISPDSREDLPFANHFDMRHQVLVVVPMNLASLAPLACLIPVQTRITLVIGTDHPEFRSKSPICC